MEVGTITRLGFVRSEYPRRIGEMQWRAEVDGKLFLIDANYLAEPEYEWELWECQVTRALALPSGRRGGIYAVRLIKPIGERRTEGFTLGQDPRGCDQLETAVVETTQGLTRFVFDRAVYAGGRRYDPGVWLYEIGTRIGRYEGVTIVSVFPLRLVARLKELKQMSEPIVGALVERVKPEAVTKESLPPATPNRVGEISVTELTSRLAFPIDDRKKRRQLKRERDLLGAAR